MKIPVIRVKDGLSQVEHIVGFNSGDKLYIDNNTIKYENLNNQSGTELNEYLFIGNKDELSGEISVEMISFEEYVEMLMAKLTVTSEKYKELSRIKEEYIRAEEKEQEEIEQAILLLAGNMKYADTAE